MSKNHPNNLNSKQRNTLGISPDVYVKLLERLDHETLTAKNSAERRSYTRIEYHFPFVDITLSSKEMSRTSICVAGRNISRKGVSVLHSNYIYPGTSASVRLNRLDESFVTVRGRVTRCEHVGGIVHEVGISFDEPVHPQEYVRCLPLDSFRSLNKVEPEQLHGPLDVITSKNESYAHIQSLLDDTNLEMQQYASAEEFLMTDPSDERIVLIIHDQESINAPRLSRQLRVGDYHGPVLLTGPIVSKYDQGSVQLSLADMYIPMPIDRRELQKAIGEYLLYEWSPGTFEITRSFQDPTALEHIRSEIAKISVRLDQLFRTNNCSGLIEQCKTLESAAILIGANALIDITQQIVAELEHSRDCTHVEEQIRELRLMISNMKNAA